MLRAYLHIVYKYIAIHIALLSEYFYRRHVHLQNTPEAVNIGAFWCSEDCLEIEHRALIPRCTAGKLSFLFVSFINPRGWIQWLAERETFPAKNVQKYRRLFFDRTRGYSTVFCSIFFRLKNNFIPIVSFECKKSMAGNNEKKNHAFGGKKNPSGTSHSIYFAIPTKYCS